MINIIERDLRVDASLMDASVKFGFVPTLAVAQDNMCEYFEKINCDGFKLLPSCNAFFVLTKSKIKFYDYLNWLDKFKVKTELISKTKIRVNLGTSFVDSTGKEFAVCSHEMCVMDATSRSLRMINSTPFPEDLECTSNIDLSFEKMQFILDEEDLVETIKVRAINLDFYKHTNNIQYINFMFSLLDLEFIDNNIIEDFEIHYIAETRNNDELKLYKKVENNKIYFQINKDENIVTKAILTFAKK